MNRQQMMTKEFVASQLSCLAECQHLMNSFADQQMADVESQIRHQQEFAVAQSKLNKVSVEVSKSRPADPCLKIA